MSLIGISLLIIAAGLTSLVKAQPGAVGMSQQLPADFTSQTVANQVLQSLQQALGSQVTQYTPISYRIQQVAGGANYFMKVYIASTTLGNMYVHMRVAQGNNAYSLNGLELNRQASDPISYIFVKQCAG